MGQTITKTSEAEKAKITHVIFDLDGTLINSEEQYFQLQIKCLRKFGKEFDIEQKRALLGCTTDKEIKQIIDTYRLKDLVTENEYRQLYESQYEHFLSKCPDMPGANKLINHLHQSKIPMAICTNSTQLQFDLKMRPHPHWQKMIPLAVIAASDPEVKRPKPAPDPYIVTLKRFDNKPESPKNVLVFEDSVTGAMAAIEAGVNVIMIPQTCFASDETHKQIEALRPKLVAILNSFADFEPTQFGLPPYN